MARAVMRRCAWVAGAALAVIAAAPAASAASAGSIDHVENVDGTLKVLYSVPSDADASADLGSLKVTIEGERVPAKAALAAQADNDTPQVRRTAILAMDVSNSMEGERFAQAKLAAHAFLDSVSPDVYVGVVAFAGDVTTEQEPTLDRAASAQVIDELSLSKQTRLYDGVIEAAETVGAEGQRSVLVLSDGADTSGTALAKATRAIEDADVKLDVVALAQTGTARDALERLAGAGEGTVLSADDPKALTAVFASEAQALADQLLISAELPANLRRTEGTLGVAISAGDETFTDTAFVTLQAAGAGAETSDPQPVAPPRFEVSADMMMIGLAAAGVAVLVLLLSAFGVFTNTKTSIEDRVAAFASGTTPPTGFVAAAPSPRPEGLTGSAVGMAEKALATNKGLTASIGARLEAAGMSLKPAEWVLMHAGIAIGSGFLGLLLSSGGLLLTFLLLVVGAAVPWFYLGFKRSKRIKAFNGQLADTLQLMSGSLSAGLSLAQSVDTVVRQGNEPMTSEFKRALIEARLGVQIEDALESTAGRMDSEDFKWVVMAVRIQREVGGNLAEVLNQVASTIRERAYLRRQVKTLSAEGRLSAVILCGLPVVVGAFLLFFRPNYLEPMITSLIGWAMLGAAGFFMVLGVAWMSKLVKIEV
jgi:tight adherence protein B